MRVVRLEKARPIVHSERARGERPNPTHVYWKPSSFRCSLQSTGIWSVSRINFLAAFRVFKNVQKLQGFRIVARHDAGSHMKRPPAGPLFVSSGSACFAAVKVFAYEIRLGKSHACEGLLTTLFGIPGMVYGLLWQRLSPSPRPESIPNRGCFRQHRTRYGTVAAHMHIKKPLGEFPLAVSCASELWPMRSPHSAATG